ncbi:MAG: cyclic nucleotide-binding domain-containing protein [Methylacidiphilales bacterium]|nr:cyclic nucleotide-binding domain-containing protein [Candidatus Methylacidiphilales bacterium]
MSFSARTEYFWNAIRHEVAPGKLLPSLVTSSVVAMMTVVLSVSFVALIFVDPLSGFVGEGTSLMLLTAVILGIFMAVFSSYAGTIAIPQDRVAPIVALMATLIIHEMRGTDPERIGITVLAAIATSTLLVGLGLFVLGAYKLGNIIRFTPYPVIGGFLAGSGWLLLTGSFRVISGEPFSLLELKEMIFSGAIMAWIPCAVFGTIAYLAVRYSRHYLTLPVLVLFAAVAFYAWIGIHHYSLGEARQNGWILGAPPDAGLKHILTFPSLLHADWSVVLHQYSSLIALLLTSIVSILLNTSALELAADEEIDLNKELRAAGLANLFGGFAGGMTGFQSLSLSSLPLGMGVRSRVVGLVSAFACLLLLWFGTGLLGYIPKFILAGILFYNGLAFLTEWVFDSWFRLVREDYFLVVLILGIVAVAGYLQGVGSGIIIATVLFVYKYSSVNVISNILSGDSHHSSVDRSPLEARLLNNQGGRIHIMRLKGFIFFGSANNLLNTIRERQADRSLPRLAYVILDFQQVSGLDTSGIVSMSKLSRLAKKEGFMVLAASVPVDIQNSFRSAGLLEEGPGQVRLFRDRDYSIEWCENEILKNELTEVQKEIKSLPQILQDFHPWRVDTSSLLNYMERLDVAKNYYLILQGDPAHELFFIESGKVKVMVELDNGRTMRIRTMGAGTVVGEIGLYLDQQRTASVVTEEPCTIYRLDAAALQKMEQENPALASAFHEFMVRVLAERVTQQNRTLRALVE